MKKNHEYDDLAEQFEREILKMKDELCGLAVQIKREIGPLSCMVGKATKKFLREAGVELKGVWQSVAEEQPESVKKKKQKKQKEQKQLQRLRSKYTDQKIGAIALGVMAAVFLIKGAGLFNDMEFANGFFVIMLSGLMTWGSICCAKKMGVYYRFKLYYHVMERRTVCSLSDLASATQIKERRVAKDLRALVQENQLTELYYDVVQQRLYSSRQACDDEAVHIPLQTQDEKPPVHEHTTDTLCDFAHRMEQRVEKIDKLNVRAQVQQLCSQARSLAQWLARHPEDASEAKRLAEYYLPTTLKLVDTYLEVRAHTNESKKAQEIQASIEGLLTTVNCAFASLRDDILSGTAMNVSAEISAMEAVLVQDGLKDDGLPRMGESNAR